MRAFAAHRHEGDNWSLLKELSFTPFQQNHFSWLVSQEYKS